MGACGITLGTGLILREDSLSHWWGGEEESKGSRHITLGL